ncbi:TetR/AcrR family transcriptional regulator [Pseudomonas sp. BGr12]|uniref:TetR/AcrR family transcriptional regulator n=1 Tax=Pseudomonas sp. BGr12 TaxID=2936269 RepID=UPI002559A7F2|nr:TetR/AcrR family transcriptional regulator [Pseudomonas sp. BJa5]MDL2426299.1 TetR/AcrR family transcriptional regulator [Pseudomonas sp. BJa5]
MASDQANPKEDRSVSPRKAPQQARAMETCARILEGTRKLLEDEGAAAITTRNIARVSGVNVASIYQYYPNKQAILYALTKERLDLVIAVFDRFNTPELLKKPAAEYFYELNEAVGELQWYGKVDIELDKAIDHDTQLSDLFNLHTYQVVERVVSLLRHFGSTWPDEKLREYAIYLYAITDSIAKLQAAGPSPHSKEWEKDHSKHLIEYCLN